MIRRFWKWLKGWFVDEQPTGFTYIDDTREDYRRRHAQRANICLARRTSMKHERRNARRTLDALRSLGAKGIL